MLKDDAIFEKTALGKEEIIRRAGTLDLGARRVLIVVDGQRSVAQIVAALGKMVDVRAMLEILVAEGYIAPRKGGRATANASVPPLMGNAIDDTAAPPSNKSDDTLAFATAKAYLMEFANGLLGADGRELVQEIANCKTIAELRAFGDVCANMVASFAGRRKSEEFLKQLKRILGA